VAVELCNVTGVETGFVDWSAAAGWLYPQSGSAEGTGTGLGAGDSSAAGDASALARRVFCGLIALIWLERLFALEGALLDWLFVCRLSMVDCANLSVQSTLDQHEQPVKQRAHPKREVAPTQIRAISPQKPCRQR